MSERLQEALEVCIAAIETGVDPEHCLALYPDLQPELGEALQGYFYLQPLRSVSVPRDAEGRSRTRMLKRAELLRKRERISVVGFAPRFAIASLAVLLAFLIGSTGLFAASAQALPGDSLYGIKRTAESMSLSLTRNPAVRQSLQATYSKRRLDETQRLLKTGREQNVEFSGVVTQSAGDLWLIDGVEVVVSPSTDIFGLVEPGMEIEVRGIVNPQGWVEAESIAIRTFQMDGEIQAIRENRWMVGGLELVLNPISIVDQSLSVGETALTLVRVEEDGSFTAMVILRSADPYRDLRLLPSQDHTSSQDGRTTLEIIEFEGSLQSISGNHWTIADRQVIVTPASSILGSFQLGGAVRVRAIVNAAGNLVALEIVSLTESGLELDDDFEDRLHEPDEDSQEEAREDESSEESEDEPDESDDLERESEEEEEEEEENEEDEEHEESNKGHVV